MLSLLEVRTESHKLYSSCVRLHHFFVSTVLQRFFDFSPFKGLVSEYDKNV